MVGLSVKAALSQGLRCYLDLDKMAEELELAIPEAKLVKKLIAKGFKDHM